MSASMDKGSKDAFISFAKTAMGNIGSPERRELYHFLVQCFIDADQDVDGAVNAKEFDDMIERAATAPRRYGLAPKTEELYKCPQDRFDTRKKMFDVMDKDKNQTISLDEWVQYCTKHIAEKLQGV